MHGEIVNHPVNNGPSNALPFPYLLSPCSLFISQNPPARELNQKLFTESTRE